MRFLSIYAPDFYCGKKTKIIDVDKITSITWSPFGKEEKVGYAILGGDRTLITKESTNDILDMLGFDKDWFWNTAEIEDKFVELR